MSAVKKMTLRTAGFKHVVVRIREDSEPELADYFPSSGTIYLTGFACPFFPSDFHEVLDVVELTAEVTEWPKA